MENRNLIIGAGLIALIIAGIYLQRQKKVEVLNATVATTAPTNEPQAQTGGSAASQPVAAQPMPTLPAVETSSTALGQTSTDVSRDDDDSPAFLQLKSEVALAAFRAYCSRVGFSFSGSFVFTDFELQESAPGIYMFESGLNKQQQVFFVLAFDQADFAKVKETISSSKGVDFSKAVLKLDSGRTRFSKSELGTVDLGERKAVYFAGQGTDSKGIFIAWIQPVPFSEAQIQYFQKALPR